MRLRLWKAIKNLFSDISYMGFLEPDKNVKIIDIEDSFGDMHLCFITNAITEKYGYAIFKNNNIVFIMYNNSGDDEYHDIVRSTVRTKYIRLKSEQYSL